MATVAAGPVSKDLDVKDDSRTAKMPTVNTGLLDGPLAWRQHDGGHIDAPNWQYFLPWATRLLNTPGPLRNQPSNPCHIIIQARNRPYIQGSAHLYTK
jgi:hypothetical protein